MSRTIIAGILGISGLLLFIVSKSIFTELPTNSEFAWVFALCSLVGLGLILATCRCFAPVNNDGGNG